MKEADKEKQLDLAPLRRKLQNKQGKQYWRSLEELAETDEFRQLVENEFPSSPLDWDKGLSRRRFLQVMGASLALAGLNACTRQPSEMIFPYVVAPEEFIPGKPLFYATAVTLGGYATGVLAESHMGRPTKIEGNPEHPASLGATDVFAQASMLQLYDPDRSQVVKHVGRISTWESFLVALRTELEAQKAQDGAGVRILTGTITSPTLASQLKKCLARYPLAKWHQYEPVGRDNFKAGAQLAFGEFVDCQYNFEDADVILSLDGDFLSNLPGSLVYARKFTARRNADHEAVKMNRLYAVESSPSLTGAMADHRLALKASEVAGFALAVAHEVGVNADGAAFAGKKSWIAAVARDLKKHRGRCLVVAGEYQSPQVHYLAHALNAALGNVGKTVFYTRSVEANPVLQADSIAELANDMAAGAVDLLVIVGGNPVFDAPANLDFSEKMAQVKMRVHLNLYEDETSNLCHWHVPESHALESWSDARAFDGTATIIQPLIAPLYGSQSAHELLAAIHDEVGKSGHDIVREFWAEQAAPQDFEKFWRVSLHDGVVAGTSFSTKSVKMRGNVELQISKSRTDSGLEVIFRPDPNIWDGRFANNGWLQELPRPLTKLTWDNAALVSPATAEQLGVSNEEVISISVGDRSVAAPVWILPGHVDGALTLNFGFGRTHVGQVGKGAGLNVYPLRTSGKAWMATGAQITKTGDRVELAGTQDHSSMEGRDIVRSASLKDYVEHPEMFHEMGHDPPPELSLYPAYEYNGYAWGMVVDLNTCIGCNACTIACQSENNISVVGKEQVLNGREMHWIRIDRYYEGDLDNPETYHQPVMCQHCENAPCEVVCPVAATTHSKEGLNEMTYNRCVGTRYCANNCPYKVRRFNFFLYADLETESLKLMRNPDVTVRTRGIMEKCTYCVQRINVARIEAKKEGRNIRDGEIVTACQQVCPADAIVFGDINDSESRVSRLKAGHRNYGILTELGVRPRTSYLAKIKNPNPEIVAA